MLHILWLSICGLVALYCAYSVWHFSRLEDIAVRVQANGGSEWSADAARFARAARFWRAFHLLVGLAAVFQIFA